MMIMIHINQLVTTTLPFFFPQEKILGLNEQATMQLLRVVFKHFQAFTISAEHHSCNYCDTPFRAPSRSYQYRRATQF